MSTNVTLGEIKRAIAGAKSAIVVCHIDPDPDTIGSMIAASLALKSMNIKTVMYSRDEIPETYRFLPHTKDILRKIPNGAHYDIAIVVDAGDIKRAGDGLNLKKIAGRIINIDHHTDNTRFGDINFIRNVSSSAELVYDICKYLKIPITKDMAECLYTAIVTDTGSFRYENTSVTTFSIAADLLRCGASPHDIAIKIYESRSISSLRILALALNGLKTRLNGKVVWACVTRNMIRNAHAGKDELTSIVDHLRSIASAEVAILIREGGSGEVKVNLRSRKRVNVQKIARDLGGGGHARAAGVSIRGKLPDVEERVLKVVLSHMM